MSKKSYIMKLANELHERGLAYDRSDALKLAYKGQDKTHYWGLDERGRFFYELLD